MRLKRKGREKDFGQYVIESMSKQRNKIRYFVGIDEVGRGPLAGPVTLGAFVIPFSSHGTIDEYLHHLGVKDSKMLSPHKRETLVGEIKKSYVREKENGVFLLITSQSARVIDEKGIAVAIRRALTFLVRKVERETGCSWEELFFFLDGSLSLEGIAPYFETIVHGDRENILIATASIFAKVYRDALMLRYAKKYPHYGFEKHKGYGTAFHREQIAKYGPSPIHRVSWIKER